MRTSGRFLFPLILVALFLASPTWPETPQTGKAPAAPYQDPDAYEVYSAVLPMDGWWQDSKSLLILQELPPKEWPIGSPRDALQGDAEFAKRFDSVFMSFEQANKQELLLQYHFAIQKPYQIVSAAELQASFSSHPVSHNDTWESFRQSFPGCEGYLILSAVGFNSDKTIAMVYVEHRCGGLCGASRYYILEKRQGRWLKYKPKGLKSEVTGVS